MSERMSRSQVLDLLEGPPTVDVPTASQALGFGPALGYDLIRRGEFPCRVLRVGRKLRVPTEDLLRALGLR